ncbi:MAG: hypothetical protein IT308_07195 [Anaerolineaceae bacterium]|nr:hypothetical protein [Anaerolineaceae bacterium]
MKTGMLWFDNDSKTDLPSKINTAAAYYQKKYGCRPNLCFVHPSMLQGSSPKAQNIDIQSNQMIMPHHLWLGIHENGTAGNPPFSSHG